MWLTEVEAAVVDGGEVEVKVEVKITAGAHLETNLPGNAGQDTNSPVQRVD